MSLTYRMLSQLSRLRLGNLHSRLMYRCKDAAEAYGDDSQEHIRALAVLGRFRAITGR